MNRSFDDDDDFSREPASDPTGRVIFDDRGNAVWNTGKHKTLKVPHLSIADDDPKHGLVPQNKVGMKSGYNPYESGLLKGGKKDGFTKKKDLAALSKWIKLKKNMSGANED